MRHLLLFGLLLAAIIGAGAYQLAYKDPAGAVRWYRTEITLTGNFTGGGAREAIPVAGAISFISRELVTGLNSDGTAKIVTRITDGKMHMTVGDQEMSQPLTDYIAVFNRAPAGNITELKVEGDPQNKMAALQPLGFGSQWQLISGIGQAFEFPANDLKPGAKWRQTITTRTTATTINNILRGPKMADGASYLAIDSQTAVTLSNVTVDIPTGDQTVTLKQTGGLTANSNTLFDEENGELVQTNFTGELKLVIALPGADKPVTVTGLLKLTGATTKIPAPAEPAPTEKPAAGDAPDTTTQPAANGTPAATE